MNDELSIALALELARALPDALDDEALASLAVRLVPFLESHAGSTSADGRLLTAREAADHARVHVETIRRAIRAGELPVAGRVGRSPRVHVLEVDRWLAAGAEGGGTIRLSARRRASPARSSDPYSLRAAFRAAGTDRA